MAANGITSFTDPGIDGQVLAWYAEMAAAGRLKARLTALLAVGRSTASVRAAVNDFRAPTGADPRWVRVAGVKLHADGIPTGNKTGWLHQPDQRGGNGVLVSGDGSDEQRVAEMEEMVRLAHDAGWRPSASAPTSTPPSST